MEKINKSETLRQILNGNRFTVNYYQREYRWGRKQIEQLIDDLTASFQSYYDSENHTDTSEVENYGYYYMGSIIRTGGIDREIIDGQQRLTSLTLLLIYLNNLLEERGETIDNVAPMIYSSKFGVKNFNIDVEDRRACFESLFKNEIDFTPENESSLNMLERYKDISDLFPDELKGAALPFFAYWVIERVLLLEIEAPTVDEANTIFVTMNDRGLSLNSAEMLKAFLLQQVTATQRGTVNDSWQKIIAHIKEYSDSEKSGIVNTEDVDFISMWLRGKYARTLRETKKGSRDEDYELLGDKFHEWVRQNAKVKMGLIKSEDFKTFVIVEMEQMSRIYLRTKAYSKKLTHGYEDIFYNANRDLNYQTMLMISAICATDKPDIFERKMKIVAAFVDIFASTRIFNYKKINYNSNKAILFKTMNRIRNTDVQTLGMILFSVLKEMDVSLDGILNFSLNQFTGRYMLHMLARFTAYVNTEMGNPSGFDQYMNRQSKNSYDIEHVLPDDYPTYADSFLDEREFNSYRASFGNLLILTKDKNRSYQKMPYSQKVELYLGDNVMAQSLNSKAYHNNPQFLQIAKRYNFTPYDIFCKESIKERQDLYIRLAYSLWDAEIIRELAGGWLEPEKEEIVFGGSGTNYNVEYAGRSWADAVKYGFLSACGPLAKTLYKIKKGDRIFCHVAGEGFLGVGLCSNTAQQLCDFKVTYNEERLNLINMELDDPSLLSRISGDEPELCVGVKWLKYVNNIEDGYWEKGMTALPGIAYVLNDGKTHKKVMEHFHITD